MIFEILSPYDIAGYFGKNKSVIVDIREFEEYNKCHIPTARHYSQFNTNEMLEDNIDIFNDYDNIIIYCQHGTTSIKVGLELCIKLNKLYANSDGKVYSLYGGIDNYSGLKIEKVDFE